mmetsp:Transcript_103712/g.334335  ORF Transcript_103712/g.334335 Transcript_103712/m.334335 type:complete len:104 (+) Transcript_103712:228-539(+)
MFACGPPQHSVGVLCSNQPWHAAGKQIFWEPRMGFGVGGELSDAVGKSNGFADAFHVLRFIGRILQEGRKHGIRHGCSWPISQQDERGGDVTMDLEGLSRKTF